MDGVKFLTNLPMCDRCFASQINPVSLLGGETLCLKCWPVTVLYPGTIKTSDLLPAAHAAALLDRLRQQAHLTPDQVAVYQSLKYGSATEAHRELVCSAHSWPTGEISGVWFGVPGQRYRRLLATCVAVIDRGMGEYGLTFRSDFDLEHDGGCSRLVWWAGDNTWVGDLPTPPEKDWKGHKVHLIDFTVKDQIVFNGHRQTVVARVTDPSKVKNKKTTSSDLRE